MNKQQITERDLVLEVLLKVLEEETFIHLALKQTFIKNPSLSKQEKAFITRLSEGTLERLLTLDYRINTYSKLPVKKMKPVIRTILRLSAYQLFYMDKIPARAAISEAVQLTKKRGLQGLSGFVNGLLRNMDRQRDHFTLPDINDDLVGYWSVYYSIPVWLISLFNQRFDAAVIKRVFEAYLQPAPLVVRHNKSNVGKEELLSSLACQNIQVHQSPYADCGYILENYPALTEIEAFNKGYVTAQDTSSIIAGLVAAPKPGNTVIDVCAAPGGKSLHAADFLNHKGLVIARDISPAKLALIEENAHRCKFTHLETAVWDARKTDETLLGKGDVVLADLPCSGLGIIGRKPDIKWNMTEVKIAGLAALQREILSIVQAYVKAGGLLVYSTCTISLKENEENALWFLENYPFKVIDLKERIAKELHERVDQWGFLQLLPGINDCDGFFVAAFVRE